MATETKPAWVKEVREKLARPYTPEERARIRESFEVIDRLNAGKTWPPGAFQQLLDLADQEDADRERRHLEDGQ
jgi:hypothetical protein